MQKIVAEGVNVQVTIVSCKLFRLCRRPGGRPAGRQGMAHTPSRPAGIDTLD